MQRNGVVEVARVFGVDCNREVFAAVQTPFGFLFGNGLRNFFRLGENGCGERFLKSVFCENRLVFRHGRVAFAEIFDNFARRIYVPLNPVVEAHKNFVVLFREGNDARFCGVGNNDVVEKTGVVGDYVPKVIRPLERAHNGSVCALQNPDYLCVFFFAVVCKGVAVAPLRMLSAAFVAAKIAVQNARKNFVAVKGNSRVFGVDVRQNRARGVAQDRPARLPELGSSAYQIQVFRRPVAVALDLCNASAFQQLRGNAP